VSAAALIHARDSKCAPQQVREIRLISRDARKLQTMKAEMCLFRFAMQLRVVEEIIIR